MKTSKSSTRRSSKNSSSTKKQIGRCESKSKPGTFHQQFRDAKGHVTCSCIGFKMKQRCIHAAKFDAKVAANIKASSAASSKRAAEKLAAPKFKNTRSAVIALLLKNKGKVVSITSVKREVVKVTGQSEKQADNKLKPAAKAMKRVARWSKQHGFKFDYSKSGMKLVAAA